jgi:hypothetical protein
MADMSHVTGMIIPLSLGVVANTSAVSAILYNMEA